MGDSTSNENGRYRERLLLVGYFLMSGIIMLSDGTFTGYVFELIHMSPISKDCGARG